MRAPAVRLLLLVLVAAVTVPAVPAAAADRDPGQIFFPTQVVEGLNYTDSWGDCRSGCSRSHLGVDIMAPQMTPVFAAQSGTIFDAEGTCAAGQQCHSFSLLLDGDDGRMYFYVHLNNDTPGRPNGCDHAGGMENAFAPALVDYYRAHGTIEGMRVQRGDHLGYTGSSGNAGCGVDHTHFEVWHGEGWSGKGWGDGSVNPYPIVQAARDAGNTWGAEWPGVPTERIAGSNRIQTALALSQRAFGGGAQAVVVAPATQYQEALVAAPLAAAMGGPVLLTSDGLNGERAVTREVAAEIDRLGADYAIVVGSEDRIGPAVERQLAEYTRLEDDAIRRIGGADVATMSANVAEAVLQYHGIGVPDEEGKSEADAAGEDVSLDLPLLPQTTRTQAAASDGGDGASISPLLAAGSHPDGLGWPDAIAASVLGARQIAPVLLTPYGDLHPAVARILSADGIEEVRLTGGEAALSAEVEDDVRALDRATRRLAGEDRYATALRVTAEVVADGASLKRPAISTALDYPDALAAGPALAALDQPLVLVHRDVSVDKIRTWLRNRADKIGRLDVIGGTAAIGERVVLDAAVAANGG